MAAVKVLEHPHSRTKVGPLTSTPLRLHAAKVL